MAASARAWWTCGVLAVVGCGGGNEAPKSTTSDDCAVFTAAAASPYVLPWTVGQAFTASPHAVRDTSVQRFAIDVVMPIGTDVLAMRAGEVVRVEQSFFDGDTTPGHENHVFIRHADGSEARYFHVTHDGALVNPGDAVVQGQRIALSGHTGHSSEPHLHFDVTRTCCTTPPDYNHVPEGETLPLSFHNASPDSSCGLKDGVRYTAQP